MEAAQWFATSDWQARVEAKDTPEGWALRGVYSALDLALAEDDVRRTVSSPAMDELLAALNALLGVAERRGRTRTQWLLCEYDAADLLIARSRYGEARRRLESLAAPPSLGDSTWRIARLVDVASSKAKLVQLSRFIVDQVRLLDPRDIDRGFARRLLASLDLEEGRPRVALRRIDRAQQLLPVGPYGKQVEFLLLHEEAAAFLRLGMPDVARPLVDEEWTRASALASTDPEFGGVAFHASAFNALTLQLELRRTAELVARMSEIRADARWGPMEAHRRGQLQLRYAIGLVQACTLPERSTAQREIDATRAEEALADARSLVAAPHLRLKCDVWAGWLFLYRNQVERCDSALQDARRAADALRQSSNAPATEDELALVALESRLAVARGARDRASDAMLELWPEIVRRFREAPQRDGGIDLLGSSHQQLVLTTALEEFEASEGSSASLAHLNELTQYGTLARSLGVEGPAHTWPRAEGELVLVYVPGPLSSLVFATDGAGTTLHRIEGALSIETRVARMRERTRVDRGSQRTSNTPDSSSPARALYDALVPAAVDARLRGSSLLTVVGLDGLGSPDFDALRTPRGKLVGWERPVAHLPSIPVGAQLAQRPPRPAARALRVVVGDGAAGEVLARHGLQPFEWTARHTRGFESTWPPNDLEVIAGVRATPAAIGSGDALALHVFAHGTRDPRRARPVDVLLSASQSFGAEELESAALPRLVFFAVCGAQAAPLRRGDDGHGRLGAAALLGGADVAIASHAPVEFARSRALARAFYASLLDGRAGTAAEAMHAARRSLDAAGDGSGAIDPYLSTVVGLGHRPLGVDPSLRKAPRRGARGIPAAVLYGGVGACALAALLLWRRRRRHAHHA